MLHLILSAVEAAATSPATGCAVQNATSSDIMVSHFDDQLFGGADGLDATQVALTSVIVWLITSVSVAAGIGGGGLLVPLYFISLSIEQTRAVSLSKGTIFGVAVGNFFFITTEKHPHANRPLVDYPTAIFMQGGELLGVVIGVLLNLLLPEIVTIILSAVVLSFNSYKTLKKAVKKFQSESAQKAKLTHELAKASSNSKATSTTVDTTPPPSPPEPAASATQVSVTVAPDKSLAERILAEQALRFPLWAWSLLVVMCSFFVFYSLLMGKVFDSEFDNCVPGYWPAYVTPFFLYGAIMTYMAHRNVRTASRMRAAGVEPMEGDIRWSWGSAAALGCAAIGAGVAAGLLGIGGGMILGPIFVALDFHPQVGTATTGFMVLFTAFGGTLKYLSVGKLAWRHFLWFAAIGALGGQTGQRTVKRLVVKTGRPSIVIFILGGVIALAVIVMTTFGVLKAAEDAHCGVDIWSADTTQFLCVEGM